MKDLKINETGRSMVEMLGVLAIIGVLSVAGIAGYTMAMNKYRANEILNVASQLAILAQANAESGGTGIVTATQAGYTSNIAGVAPNDLSANATTHVIAGPAGVSDEIKHQIYAASGNCHIGEFELNNTLCAS